MISPYGLPMEEIIRRKRQVQESTAVEKIDVEVISKTNARISLDAQQVIENHRGNERIQVGQCPDREKSDERNEVSRCRSGAPTGPSFGGLALALAHGRTLFLSRNARFFTPSRQG